MRLAFRVAYKIGWFFGTAARTLAVDWRGSGPLGKACIWPTYKVCRGVYILFDFAATEFHKKLSK